MVPIVLKLRGFEAITASGAGKGEGIDQAVVAALERDDRAGALKLLMQVYGDAVFHYCAARLRDPSVVPDVHQTVFIQAYNSFGSFSRTAPVGNWLFGIAHHRCVDASRDIKRRAGRISHLDQLPEERDPRPPCDDELATLELAAMVTACVNKLKSESRIALLLRYQEGLSYNEIGRMCRENPATLQQRVARAVEALRVCLQKKGARL